MNTKQVLFFFGFAFTLLSRLHAQSNAEPALPFQLADEQVRPLRQLLERDLQRRLEARLQQNKKWKKLIQKRKMAVGLVDLSNPQNIRFARVNGPVMMYAASLPKLAILLAAYEAFKDGGLEKTPEIEHDLKMMISKSDNRAATRMIDRLGLEKIQAVLQDSRYELYDTDQGGGLWVGKRYAKAGRRIPEPIQGLSHAATVTQVCRFYYLLAMGKLVDRESSSEMLDILADPELHHKFVNTLNEIVPDAKLFRKSGSWRNWHSDSVLVWGPVWRRYIVVGLIDDADGEQILRQLIPAVEDVLRGKSQ